MQPVKQDSALKALILEKTDQGKDYYLFHVPTLIIKPGEDRSARTIHPTLKGNETFMVMMLHGTWHYTFSADHKDYNGNIFDFYRLVHSSEPVIDDETILRRVNEELKLGLFVEESDQEDNGLDVTQSKNDAVDSIIRESDFDSMQPDIPVAEMISTEDENISDINFYIAIPDDDPIANVTPEPANTSLIENKSELMKDLPQPADGFVSAFDLLSMDITDIPCLVKPLLPSTGLAAIVGSSDSGKSCICRQLAIAICKGEQQFLGFELNPRTGRVIFVSTEDDPTATVSLLKRQVIDSDHRNPILSKLIFLFDTNKLVSMLDAELTSNPADLVICDSYGDLFNYYDSNSNIQVRKFLKPYSDLAKNHNCLILFVHHIGKRTEVNEPSKHNVIGSQAFESKMRVVLELRPDEEGRRYLSPVKGNYLAQEMKKSSFVLLFDESSLTFTMTEERIGYSVMGGKKTSKKGYNVDWPAVFETDQELKLNIIEQRLLELYGMPKGTANTYINNELEKVPDKYGYWRIKSPYILSVEVNEQEELNPRPVDGNNDPQS